MAILPKRNRYGVAVLVAISIPIFTTQLEKSREAVDLANIRSAYAEVAAEALADDTKDCSAVVTLKQSDTSKWVISDDTTVAGVKITDIKPTSNQVSIKYDHSKKQITIADKVATSTSISATTTPTTPAGQQ